MSSVPPNVKVRFTGALRPVEVTPPLNVPYGGIRVPLGKKVDIRELSSVPAMVKLVRVAPTPACSVSVIV